MYKYAVPYRIHRRCTSTLYPLESTADASSLQLGNLESTCAIQNKNHTLGTNPSVVSRILVLFYLPLALHIRSQQKQAQENARNGNALVNATKRKKILNAGRHTLAHNLSFSLLRENLQSQYFREHVSRVNNGIKNSSEVRGNTYAASLFFPSLMNTTWLNTAGDLCAHPE